ncbi:MAG: CopG family transcriptional regulator [Thermoplasmata archaeon]|nr:CopG family transcriptional regulator [Thermoplasmata archaeon]
MSEQVEVHIPALVAQKIQERIQGTGFGTVDEFVTFVLARLLESSSDVPFSEEEEKRLKERLRSLGYID